MVNSDNRYQSEIRFVLTVQLLTVLMEILISHCRNCTLFDYFVNKSLDTQRQESDGLDQDMGQIDHNN